MGRLDERCAGAAFVERRQVKSPKGPTHLDGTHGVTCTVGPGKSPESDSTGHSAAVVSMSYSMSYRTIHEWSSDWI